MKLARKNFLKFNNMLEKGFLSQYMAAYQSMKLVFVYIR